MTAMRRLSCALLLIALLLPASALAQQYQVKSHTLKNGMKILVQEDHSIPNVVLYIFYRKIITLVVPPENPHLRNCPYCFTKIDSRCTVCPACTSKVEPAEKSVLQ